MEVVLYVLLGVCVGTMSSFFGIGGGVTIVAALVALSEFGQQEAQATALAFMIPTATIGFVSVRRHGLGDLRGSALLGAGAALGAIPGALLALELPGETLRYLFAAFLAVNGAMMLWRSRSDGGDPAGEIAPEMETAPPGRGRILREE